MASWIVHLRVADNLLCRIPNLSADDFIMGNIAPDSGVPNQDWSAFSPSTTVSHFKKDGEKANPSAFASKYFSSHHRKGYSPKEDSFYLGYLVHLITDVLWSDKIAKPTFARFVPENTPNRRNIVWSIKEDWYDLDFCFLQDHPGFRAFSVYSSCENYRNSFMEEFSEDAFDDRRRYITAFYTEKREHLDRSYIYLTKEQMDAFVEEASAEVLEILREKYLAI